MRTGRLTALKVKSLIVPGRHGDGGGLWLQVRDAEHRSWLFRFTMNKKARHMGLGSLEDVSLAEARALAAQCRKHLSEGIDPIGRRLADKAAVQAAAGVLTFREVADRYLAAHEASWRHTKHKAQWRSSLDRYVHPVIGDLQVDRVATAEVMRILEPIWARTPETASRVRGRIEALLDYAKAREWRTGENPARWRGHVANMLPKRNRARSIQHYPALAWKAVADFMKRLRSETGGAALALEFTILTAARTGETLGSTWGEIDLEAEVWTVPAGRMKAGKQHRVPLSRSAMAVLKRAAGLRTEQTETAHVFPGGKPRKPLSNMSMSMLLRRMGCGDITTHGFRSCFRDWAAECSAAPKEVAEACLAHTIGDVERAYRRSDLLQQRRLLLDGWAMFCDRLDTEGGGVDAAGAPGLTYPPYDTAPTTPAMSSCEVLC